MYKEEGKKGIWYKTELLCIFLKYILHVKGSNKIALFVFPSVLLVL